jgi:F-type H+-transporting ATPase subunit delta
MARFVETSGGIVAGLSGRYATALYQLASEDKSVDKVAASLATVHAALAESADLAALTTSPLIDRKSAGAAIAATAKSLKLDTLTTKFLGVLAGSRRLASLPAIIRDYNRLMAAARGETTAEVTSAHPLTAKQQTALKAKLKAGLKRDVALDLKVDPEILGGLIVRVGSRMIDSSLATKLNSLGQRLKG